MRKGLRVAWSGRSLVDGLRPIKATKRERVCVCDGVRVRERVGERNDNNRENEDKNGSVENVSATESMYVCVCVCVCEEEKEKGRQERARGSAHLPVGGEPTTLLSVVRRSLLWPWSFLSSLMWRLFATWDSFSVISGVLPSLAAHCVASRCPRGRCFPSPKCVSVSSPHATSARTGCGCSVRREVVLSSDVK